MEWLAGMFALFTAVAGWYYLFFSKAAADLAGVEAGRINRLRVRLRKAGGVAMLLLAVLFYAGFNSVRAEAEPGAFLAVWLGVLVALGAVTVLALADVYLTRRLRQSIRKGTHRE